MESPLTDLETLRKIIEIHFNQLEANKNEKIVKNEELRLLEEQRAKIEEQLQILLSYHNFISNNGFEIINEMLKK